jgi:membrane-anchored mycosin MYCP
MPTPAVTERVTAALSNFGPGLAVSAPGVQIASLIPGGGFGTADGSSFAAPWVAGAAALLRVRCPALTPDEIRERLMAESTPINALNPNHVAQLGAGMLNALRPLRGLCIIAPPRAASPTSLSSAAARTTPARPTDNSPPTISSPSSTPMATGADQAADEPRRDAARRTVCVLRSG